MAWRTRATRPPQVRSPSHRRRLHVWAYDIEHAKEQRLHPIETLGARPIDTERDQLVQEWCKYPSAVLSKAEYLGRLGVELVGEVMRLEPVCKQLGMLPEDLVDDVVLVQAERGDGD